MKLIIFIGIYLCSLSFYSQEFDNQFFECKNEKLFYCGNPINQLDCNQKRTGLWIDAICLDSGGGHIILRHGHDENGDWAQSEYIDFNVCECVSMKINIFVSSLGYYKNGLKNGMWTNYNIEGRFVNINYVDGEILGTTFFFNNFGKLEYKVFKINNVLFLYNTENGEQKEITKNKFELFINSWVL